MPVYNGAATVGRAIRSIVNQTCADWELIIIDDGSTDKTPVLLRQASTSDARVHILQAGRRGIVNALTVGLKSARARCIARMDADDEAYPDRLAEQWLLLEQRPELGLVGSLVEYGGDPLTSRGYALHAEWVNTLCSPEEIALNRFVESPFAHPSVMFRRDLIARYGGYRNGDFPEDYELWLRWLDAGVLMAKVPRMLLRWNDSSQRLSRTDQRYRTDAFYRCKGEYLARWLVKNVEPARPILVWGAGRLTRQRAEHLVEHGMRLSGYIDVDPAKQGCIFSGRPVLAPHQIPAGSFVLSYVANRGARELIRGQLRGKGFFEGRDFLMAA